jgi:glucoamylase
VPIKNRPWEQADVPACQIVSPDALALVRFGLRAADDPKILNTVRVIDALLKVETPFGPLWRRYNGDGYGEHEDGSAFDGVGVGRPWPLLAGERAHYEIAAGRQDEARRLLRTMEACASEGGLLPEQTWDGPDVPERELYLGRPSGSAMPLVWAHAEHLKLCRSLADGRVFDLPPQTTQRYVIDRTGSRYAFWRFNHRVRAIDESRTLRVETLVPCLLHWSVDGWRTVHDTQARNPGLGEYVIDLPTQTLPAGARIDFTFYWPEADRWELTDFFVVIASSLEAM